MNSRLTMAMISRIMCRLVRQMAPEELPVIGGKPLHTYVDILLSDADFHLGLDPMEDKLRPFAKDLAAKIKGTIPEDAEPLPLPKGVDCARSICDGLQIRTLAQYSLGDDTIIVRFDLLHH